VHAVPQILARGRPLELVTSLIAELARAGTRGYTGAIDLALATLACHGSVRAGDAVSPAEAKELLAALAKIELGGYCPHGRPVVMRLSFRELEHRVGRR
jgi:DNA mismatch repair protein MutL